MNLSRRDTTIGLGTLLVGAGVIGGVGAFDTVGAEREVSIEFADDSAAILAMGPADGDRSFVVVEAGEDGTIGILIDRVNRNARTVIDDILAFTNNGSRAISSIEATMVDSSENAELSVHDGLDGVTIGPGETVIGLGITINTLRADGHVGAPELNGTIRISTETEVGGS